jgi:hypothetical protein
MEAAGAPRLDVERPFKRPLNAGRWSAWANAAGQEWALLPSYAVALAEGRSARLS